MGSAQTPPAPQIPDVQSVFFVHGIHAPAMTSHVLASVMQSRFAMHWTQAPELAHSGRLASRAVHSDETPASGFEHGRHSLMTVSQIGSVETEHWEDCVHAIGARSGIDMSPGGIPHAWRTRSQVVYTDV